MTEWIGFEGSVWLSRRRLAEVDAWQFEVEPPLSDADFTSAALKDRLRAAGGHFVIEGGGPEVLVEAVRSEKRLTLRCVAGGGTFEAEVTVDPLAREEGVVYERHDLFRFVVADVRLIM